MPCALNMRLRGAPLPAAVGVETANQNACRWRPQRQTQAQFAQPAGTEMLQAGGFGGGRCEPAPSRELRSDGSHG